MQPWMQVYDPAGNLWVSAFVAALPIIFFFVALAVLRMKGHIAATITVAIALAVAILFYEMPVDQALASAGYGFVYGLWPIAWIILTAVFLYKVTVKTGQFDIIRSSVVSITEDQRLQMLLVGFSFAFFYHLFNGVRHLTWDTGRGLERKALSVGKQVEVMGYPHRSEKGELRAERITVDGKTVELR